MKIGYVLKSFPRLSETFILTEMLELERLGCDITVFSRHSPVDEPRHAALSRLRAEVIQLEPLLRERFWESFETHRALAERFADRHARAFDCALRWRNREEMRYWLQAGAVAQAAEARGLALLHGHFATGSASLAWYAGQIAGLPYSFTAHAKDIYANEVDRDRLRAVMRDASSVVTISETNRRFLAQVEPTADVRLVYNGIDVDAFAPRDRPAQTGPPLLLFVGRLVEKKAVADLIDACALLWERRRPVKCRIVGTGELEAALRERAVQRGLQGVVEFTGAVTQEQVAEDLARASMLVMPAIVAADGDRDGIPTTLLEAMAAGVPVVSTMLSGIPEAVPHRTAGLLAEPGDIAGLARAIEETLDDPAATAGRVVAARAHVEARFDARRNAPLLLEVFSAAARARAA